MSTFKSRLITAVILILGFYLTFSLAKGTYNLWQRAERVKEAQEERMEAEKKNRELKEKLEFVQSPKFVEKEAREKLGLAKPGETVVIMTPQEATSSAVEKNLPNWKKWWELFF